MISRRTLLGTCALTPIVAALPKMGKDVAVQGVKARAGDMFIDVHSSKVWKMGVGSISFKGSDGAWQEIGQITDFKLDANTQLMHGDKGRIFARIVRDDEQTDIVKESAGENWRRRKEAYLKEIGGTEAHRRRFEQEWPPCDEQTDIDFTQGTNNAASS